MAVGSKLVFAGQARAGDVGKGRYTCRRQGEPGPQPHELSPLHPGLPPEPYRLCPAFAPISRPEVGHPGRSRHQKTQSLGQAVCKDYSCPFTSR